MPFGIKIKVIIKQEIPAESSIRIIVLLCSVIYYCVADWLSGISFGRNWKCCCYGNNRAIHNCVILTDFRNRKKTHSVPNQFSQLWHKFCLKVLFVPLEQLEEYSINNRWAFMVNWKHCKVHSVESLNGSTINVLCYIWMGQSVLFVGENCNFPKTKYLKLMLSHFGRSERQAIAVSVVSVLTCSISRCSRAVTSIYKTFALKTFRLKCIKIACFSFQTISAPIYLYLHSGRHCAREQYFFFCPIRCPPYSAFIEFFFVGVC